MKNKYLYILMEDDNISKRFISGLNKYNLTIDDIKNDWNYMGGTKGEHKKYFDKNHKDEDMPETSTTCVCGHKIKNNCFITDGENVLIVGTACAKRFVPRHDRICEKCGHAHRNRKDNRCNKCRKLFTITRPKENYIILSFK